ncbi:MAG: DUF362 domain-containing protein [Pyrinomonadaceae bacterium]
MPLDLQSQIKDSRVSAVKLMAEYPSSESANEVIEAVRQNAENLGWAKKNRGAFGNLIKENSRVVIKPNFVLHANQGDGGLLPLITHPSVIKAVAAEILKANPARLIIGDAPIQSCDFGELMRVTRLDEWSANLQKSDARFKGVRDFRRTVNFVKNGVRVREENARAMENFVLYNLGADSLLEPLTDDKGAFRVTRYDPRLMAKTHSPGNHQYLVAREVIEADVVINLPKLKTHKKAGITNALKNLVGINGNKEFLPHHRTGSAKTGGDCYPTSNFVKRALETVLDWENMNASPAKGKFLSTLETQLARVMRLQGDEIGVEGAWSGNETVPRMCLDLNRILLYGKPDGTIGDAVQRQVLHIVDAIIAGQGDGPLASEELPLGLILAGQNAAAIDWVGASLLGYDAPKIPLLREAFKDFRWRIADFSPDEIKLLGNWENDSAAALPEFAKRQTVKIPAGWQDAKA